MTETPEFQNRFEGNVKAVIQSERVNLGVESQHFTPWELCHRPRAWTDRERHLQTLVETLESPHRRPIVLTGPSEVGKTALASVAASMVKHRYPDGVLHIELNGTFPDHALRSALGRLGQRDIPGGFEDLHKCYLSILAVKRVLVILDGARTKYDIERFWPRSDSAAYIVLTSRTLSWHEASQTHLPPLAAEDAAELLQRATTLDSAVADQLVKAFGGSPGQLLRAAGIVSLDAVNVEELLGLVGEGRERRLFLKAFESVGEETQRVYMALSRLPMPILEQSLLDALDADFDDPPSEDLKTVGLIVEAGPDQWRLAPDPQDSERKASRVAVAACMNSDPRILRRGGVPPFSPSDTDLVRRGSERGGTDA
ncbi:hypothetical protein [Glycomyces tenuis]|uniref:hypothetical protein n=1 Tax=Glycomyces tenuis TaxID=58116 RepID=UPI00041FA9FC|nr:hypothetical protein [Glycomyces tenuis]